MSVGHDQQPSPEVQTAALVLRFVDTISRHLDAMTGPLEVFSVRDLRHRASDLIRDAEEGKLAIITKHGRPAILAIPFDERLLSYGLHRALALHLFEAGQVTIAQAAKLAELAMESFMELLAQAGVPAVNYPSEELAVELETAR